MKFTKMAAFVLALVAGTQAVQAGITSGYVEAVDGHHIAVHGKRFSLRNATHRRDHYDLRDGVEEVEQLEVGDRVTIHWVGAYYEGVDVYAFRPHDHRAVRQSGERAARFAYERRWAAKIAAKEAAQRRHELALAKVNALAEMANAANRGNSASEKRDQEEHDLRMRLGNARVDAMNRAVEGLGTAATRVNFGF